MRYILVDRYVELVPGARARALKCVTRNDASVAGSFSWHADWPPVLLIEGMAQTAAACLATEAGFEGVYGLVKVEGAEFLIPIRSGDVVEYDMRLSERMSDCVRFEGQARVDGRTVASAIFFLAALDVEGFTGTEQFHARWRDMLEMQGAFACLAEGSHDPGEGRQND